MYYKIQTFKNDLRNGIIRLTNNDDYYTIQ